MHVLDNTFTIISVLEGTYACARQHFTIISVLKGTYVCAR